MSTSEYTPIPKNVEGYSSTSSALPEPGHRAEGCTPCPTQHELAHMMPEDEQTAAFAGRCLLQNGWLLIPLYICMIAVSTFLIVWMIIGNTESEWWFITLEVLVTLVIVAEVALNMIAYRKDFWGDGWNILDFIVMLLCVASLLVYFFDSKPAGQKGDDVTTLAVLGIRYVAQGLRMATLASRISKSQERAEVSYKNVEFDPEVDKNAAATDVGTTPHHSQEATDRGLTD